MTSQKILVIGAGELGFQVLRALVAHPRRPATIAVLMRPGSIDSSSPSKQKQKTALQQLGIDLVSGDIVEDSERTLASIFANYDTVIGCTGFVSGTGVQLKITRAALVAEIPRFIPWQFGVDYDAIGRGSPQDLFDEQLDVRDLLRSQAKTHWAIVSTGMFTSFLFEPSFGVVDLENARVNALGSLENQVTITTAQDIGLITAEIVLGDEDLFNNRPIFIGGDTISYGELAQLVERLTRNPITRNVLTMEKMQDALASDPQNGLLKYQAVFGQGHGVAWELASTWNQQRGIQAETAEEWARKNWAGVRF
ncbi:hypothetical protein N7509_013927 [Penicillium cosmopolitanum]|uniref:NmrA-like domain-containing protein n=1 Tax=Penicillium cosmopolitanum TaxID=1131564 RepID=A0A9W9SEC2_9EURO|nr:uncharacterized protein N7509_013927 [Penicillium cosmopolitanum]KAJ5377041.1 hypothetical protein N7509_013927 [Penicillium cosmopolitanum]